MSGFTDCRASRWVTTASPGRPRSISSPGTQSSTGGSAYSTQGTAGAGRDPQHDAAHYSSNHQVWWPYILMYTGNRSMLPLRSYYGAPQRKRRGMIGLLDGLWMVSNEQLTHPWDANSYLIEG